MKPRKKEPYVNVNSGEITILVNGMERKVTKKRYCEAKAKDLREFGYSTVSEEEVAAQLRKILNGEPITVIGEFMKDEIVIEPRPVCADIKPAIRRAAKIAKATEPMRALVQ